MSKLSSRGLGIVFAVLPWLGLGAQATQAGAANYPIEHLIADRARVVRLDAGRTARAAAGGITATFTPAVQSQLPTTQAALESGVVLGELTIAGAGGPVPPGQYHLYVAHSRTGWMGALEQNGKLAATTNGIIVDTHPALSKPPEPVLRWTRRSISFEIETVVVKIRGTF
jgi:hypothetical protein